MNSLIHTFDENGIYLGSSEMPPFAATPNLDVATLDPLPDFDLATQICRRVNGEWVVQIIPLKESAPEPEQPSPQYPLFVGNQKLDLFTHSEQLAVVTATMQDPVVKLLYDRLLGSAYWSYKDPETEQGLTALVDKGLLTPERKAAIVSEMQPR